MQNSAAVKALGQKQTIMADINSSIAKTETTSLTLAQRIGLANFSKTVRAQQSDLEKEKWQVEAIQIDLGVDLMTGNILREKVPKLFSTQKDLEKNIEVLAQMAPEHRTHKQTISMIEIVKQMQFFQD